MWSKILNTWKILNLPCAQISVLASRELDDELSRVERWALRSHGVYCRACRRYRHQLRLLREIVQECGKPDPAVASNGPTTLSSDTLQRMKQVLEQFNDQPS